MFTWQLVYTDWIRPTDGGVRNASSTLDLYNGCCIVRRTVPMAASDAPCMVPFSRASPIIDQGSVAAKQGKAIAETHGLREGKTGMGI